MASVERRKHAVCVTRGAEYHLRDGVCVAVRRGGGFVVGHAACGARLVPAGTAPTVGARLRFGAAMATGVVLAVERPPREVVRSYAP